MSDAADEHSSVDTNAVLSAAVLEHEGEAHALGWRLEPLGDGQEGFRVTGGVNASISWKIADGAVQVIGQPSSLTQAPLHGFGPLMAGLIVRSWWGAVRKRA